MPVMLVPVVVAVNEAVVVAEDVTVVEDAELDVKVGAEVDEKEGLLRPRRASDEREGGEYDATRCDIQKRPTAARQIAHASEETATMEIMAIDAAANIVQGAPGSGGDYTHKSTAAPAAGSSGASP
ncbi:hypothetical protein KRP22_004557 [Phytophthora ramorum]|nr:hypothetical protein KRP22_14275 [Phytophthora ramorum]